MTVDEFSRALMRRLIELHNLPDVNMMTPQDIIWQLVKAIAYAGDQIDSQSDARVKHKVTCKLFPDPFDERDPVGPCTCDAGAEHG
jgi:hypothetical protein